MWCLKAIGAILPLFGVTELGVRYTYNTSAASAVQSLAHRLTYTVFVQPPEEENDELTAKDSVRERMPEYRDDHHHHGHHGHHGHDGFHHGHGEGYGHHPHGHYGHHHHGEGEGHDHPHHGDFAGHHGHHHHGEDEGHFPENKVHFEEKEGREHFFGGEAMVAAMQEVRACHHGCKGCGGCHAKCPKPWQRFEEQCDMLQPIRECHQSCGRDHACHRRCPVPQSGKWARVMEDTLACHGSCAEGDFLCHRACPKPLCSLGRKCDILKEKVACHQQCAHGDFGCHHMCPKVRDMWRPPVDVPLLL